MERLMSMLLVGVVAAVMLQCSTAQTVHVVGDSIGWTIPSNGAQGYITWASSKTFLVGDTLIFNFTTNAHDVVQVPKASFDTCSDDNEIGNPITTGPANVTLTSSGDHYYICTFGSHCQAGQKLAITVSATPGAAAPPTTPSTPTTPATPSPTSSTAPEACPPEAPTPKADGPTATTTPSTPTPPPATLPPTSSPAPEACPPETPTPKAHGPTPPTTTSTRPEVLPPSSDSASSAVLAGFSLTLLGFAVGLFL